MKSHITILAPFVLTFIFGSCNHEQDDPRPGQETKSAEPDGPPVAGTGKLTPPSDPAESLYTRTYDILPDGDLIFTGSTAGVAVFTMGDGTQPERAGGIVLPGSVSGIEKLAPGSHALAASTGPTGVALVDIESAHEGNLQLLSPGQWTKEAGCHAAYKTRHAGQGRVFVACGTSGVLEAMVDDPVAPRARRLVATGGYVRDLAVLDVKPDGSALVAAASGSAGLAVISFGLSGDPEVVGRLDTAGDARALALEDHLALVADGPAGLLVVDLSDPSSPDPVGKLDPHERDMLRGILVHEDRAYLCMGNSGLVIVDISTPRNPAALGRYVTDRAFNLAAIHGTHLLGANDDAGLLVLDVSDPAKPARLFPAAK